MALPHNITNGTRPDADEVMGNFTALEQRIDGFKVIGKVASGSVTTPIAGAPPVSQVAMFPGSDLVVVVAQPSIVAITFSAVFQFQDNFAGDFRGEVHVLRDGGRVTGANSFYSRKPNMSGSTVTEYTKSVPIVGTFPVSLTAGSHTIALEGDIQIQAIGGLGMAGGISLVNAMWTGVVAVP